MEYTDTKALYEDDDRLSLLQEALENESGERESAIEKSIRRRKKELRERHGE